MFPARLSRTLPALWTDADWESCWAPYPEDVYQAVLNHIQPDDVVLEIGAGDLRLATRLAESAAHVYALEIQSALLEKAHTPGATGFNNLTVLNQDALTSPFPVGITTAVLLMRHCTHFRLYAGKLKEAGCQTLITNARWRTGVEVISLQAERQPLEQIPLGWFGCWCGHAGFKPGPGEYLTEENFENIYEVANCPNCS